MSEENHNIDTTYVTGIICNACKKELPIMTMKEHLDGRGCPCRELENREELLDRQQKRFFVVNCVYEDFLNEMINGKKKKIVYRKWLYLRLKAGSQTIFNTEEEEYLFIQKFGRGMWSECKQTFNKEEMEKIISLAKGFGAFDY
jgi:hypothetical protein